MNKKIYPFTAIVGQEKMKKALMLNVINPKIGGVLIRGEKGTAKSTAVRALVEVLPTKEVVKDCPFNCEPNKQNEICDGCKEKIKRNQIYTERRRMKVIELPIGCTEDRAIGTLDIEHAIQTGEKKFEAGILAQANGNLLYVDEVNLLNDHIVDVLLDVAAMGVNHVEREGVSYSHPSHFILIGTMNPEEGDLRPQLLDRFGLVVDVFGERNVEDRVRVIQRRLLFEKDPYEFMEVYKEEQIKLSQKIEKAKDILNKVHIEDQLLSLTAEISIELGVDGHRADITMIKTAKTIAALNNRKEVNREDILEAAEFVLPHRMRTLPFEEGVLNKESLKKWIEGENL
ncbi:ATP-binding protein [Inediibacterium massiliense]|uniref:ATP-binding protein n=1 Tax=Inediibacterium massiliense TaxID=1658111 RepID=UPI0006B64103|nr:AAA family ATPase [Inediibacterium massiliense]